MERENSAARRSLLWNVLEPGDHYDISKSLIARLPGDRKSFMGEHLDVICLFQAAEIERLTEYLSSYKLKFKEIERKDLDRQAYEVQINELTQLCLDTEGLKIEVSKLKDFIKRLTAELDTSKQNPQVDEGLHRNYESALNEIQGLMAQTKELRSQLNSWKTRYEALDKTRLKEMDVLREESETRLALERDFRELQNTLYMERQSYEGRLQEMGDELEGKDYQLGEWEQQLSEYNRDVGQKQTELRDRLIADHEGRETILRRKIEQMGEMLASKSREIHETTIKYQAISNEVHHKGTEGEQLRARIRDHEVQNSQLNESLQQLRRRLNEKSSVNSKLEEAENKIALLSQEIVRLEYMAENKQGEVDQVVAKNKRLEQEYEGLRAEYTKLAARFAELERPTNNSPDLQGLANKLSHENSSLRESFNQHQETIYRLNTDLQRLQSELGQARKKIYTFAEQNNLFKKRIQELTYTLEGSSRSDGQLAEIQRSMRMVQSQRDNAIRQSNDLLKTIQDLQTNNNFLLNQQQEKRTFSQHTHNFEYEQRVRELQNALDKEKDRNNLGMSRYQQLRVEHEEEVREVILERDELNNIAHELQERLRSRGGEQRATSFTEEIDRLGRKLREKNDQLTKSERIVKDLQIYRHKYQEAVLEIGTLRSRLQLLEPVQNKEHEFVVAALKKELEALRKQVEGQDGKSKIVEYERRLTVFNDQIDRLKEKLAHKTNSFDQLELEMDRSRELAETESEKKLTLLSLEIQRLNQVIQRKVNKCEGLQSSLQEVSAIQREKVRSEFESRIQNSQMTQEESRRLGQLNRGLEGQIRTLEEELRSHTVGLHSLKSENDGLKRRIHELEVSTRRIQELEIEREHLLRQLEQKNRELTGSGDRLKALNEEYSKIDLKLRERQKSTVEVTRMTTQLNQKILVLTGESERLGGDLERALAKNRQQEEQIQKLNEKLAWEGARIVSQFQERYKLLENQITILQKSLVSKEQEISSHYRNLSRLQSSQNLQILTLAQQLENSQRHSSELTTSISSFQQKIFVLTSETDALRAKLQASEQKSRKLGDAQVREAEVIRQRGEVIDRLNRTIVEERQKLTRTTDQYKTNVINYDRQNSSMKQQLQKVLTLLSETDARVSSLTEENRRLKVEVNEDSQRQEMEYQVQINMFENRIQSHESKLGNIGRENEGLKRRLAEYEFQINELKSDNQRHLQQNLRADALAQEVQHLKMLLDEYGNAKETNESKLIRFGDEIERLNAKLRQKVHIIEASERKCQQALMEVKQARNKEAQMGTEKEDLQIKVAQLTQRQQISVSYTNQLHSGKLESLQKTIVAHEEQIALLSQQVYRLENLRIMEKQRIEGQFSSKLNQSLKRIKDHEDQMTKMAEEISRLNEKLRSKSEEDRLKSQEIERLTASLRSKSELEDNIAKYYDQMQRLNGIVKMKVKESQDLKQKFSGTDDKMAEYLVEIERLNNILRIKIAESQEMRDRMIVVTKEMETSRERYNHLLRQHEEVQRKLEDSQKKFRKIIPQFQGLNNIIQSQKQENISLKQKNSSLKQEIYAMQVKLNAISQQALQEKNGVLALEIQRLNKIKNQLESDISDLRLKYVDENALEKRVNEHLGLFVVLFAEIEALRRRVKDKEVECEQVRRSSLAPYIVHPGS